MGQLGSLCFGFYPCFPLTFACFFLLAMVELLRVHFSFSHRAMAARLHADLNYKQSNNQTINWLHGYPGGRSFVLREHHRDPRSMFKSVACVT
jgi:hypothetical protein